jgi:hypothetical protein
MCEKREREAEFGAPLFFFFYFILFFFYSFFFFSFFFSTFYITLIVHFSIKQFETFIYFIPHYLRTLTIIQIKISPNNHLPDGADEVKAYSQ